VTEQSEVNVGGTPIQASKDLLILIETCESIYWASSQVYVCLILYEYSFGIETTQLGILLIQTRLGKLEGEVGVNIILDGGIASHVDHIDSNIKIIGSENNGWTVAK
jgi:hypothetical protein